MGPSVAVLCVVAPRMGLQPPCCKDKGDVSRQSRLYAATAGSLRLARLDHGLGSPKKWTSRTADGEELDAVPALIPLITPPPSVRVPLQWRASTLSPNARGRAAHRLRNKKLWTACGMRGCGMSSCGQPAE